jgi:hypothetical protein
MGALGSILGMGPAHEVQSKPGQAGFRDFGDDQMGGLMRNGSGMSSPNSYNGGYPQDPMAALGRGGLPGLSGMGSPMFPGFPGGGPPQSGGMGGGQQMGGQQRPQYPYGIQPPQGLQGGGQQQGGGGGGGNPLASLFSMLGGL